MNYYVLCVLRVSAVNRNSKPRVSLNIRSRALSRTTKERHHGQEESSH